MLILAFGSLNDKQAWIVADKLKHEMPEMEIIKTSNVEDILDADEELIIIDAVRGIKKPCLLGIDDLKDRRISTLHDFDVGFFLKLMKRAGKLKKIKIIGIPMKTCKNTLIDVKKLI